MLNRKSGGSALEIADGADDASTGHSSPGLAPSSSSSSPLVSAPAGAAAAAVSPTLRYGSLTLLVMQNCTAVLLMRYVQGGQRAPFSIAVANIAVELVKLLLCSVGLMLAAPGSHEVSGGIAGVYDAIAHKQALQMAVPAGLFTIQNNLLFVALANLDATLFQVTYQLKLLCTAVLMVLMLGRSLTPLKWLSLVLLFAGIVLTQMKPGGDTHKGDDGAAAAAASSSSMAEGMAAVVTCAMCSAFSSVYFEKVLKAAGASSLLVRNVQLAVFSLAFNGAVYCWTTFARAGGGGGGGGADASSSSSASLSSPFAGFDELVWLLVLVQAAGGLLVAAVIKYADNILKGFATAVAIVVNGVISYVWLEFVPTQMFLIGASVVIGATMMYSYLP